MKSYFAKYLPVEGEIKRGDKYLHQNGNIQQLSDDVQISLLPEINKTGKLVKLFLCSRDIQVGDDIFSDDGKLTGSILFEEDKLAWEKDNPYKIIGEISPNAVWVKEGDEFDEEDISLRGCMQDLALIKCPTCKQFH